MVQSKKNSAKKSNATSSLQKDTPQNNFADFMKNEADQQTKNRVKKSVNWLDVVLDEQGNVKSKKVNTAKLGQVIYDAHKDKWLLVQDDDIREFWTYRPLKHNYGADNSIQNKLAHTQKVWQLDNIKTIRGYIHTALKKESVWNAKTETDTYKYVTGELENHIVPKAATIDLVQPYEILTADGVLNYHTLSIVPNSPSYFFTDFCDYSIRDADPNGAPLIKQWFRESFGTAALTLEQYIGYMFYPTYKDVQAFVVLKNSGGEGKTTIINFINSLMPLSEIIHVSLQQLTQAEKSSKNFSPSELYKKRLNTADDISNDFIQDGSKIKTITGGGSFNAPKKSKDDLPFSNYAKLLFACNDLPEYRDTSKGWSRRPYILTTNSIDDFRKKYDMKQLYAERGSFILYCIKEFQKQLKAQIEQGIANPRLYENEETIQNRKEWLNFNDPVQQFIDEMVVPKDQLPDKGEHTIKNCRQVKDTYNAYKEWCINANYKPLNRKTFSKEMKNKGYENSRTTINGKTAYWWYDLKLYSDAGSISTLQENNLHSIN